jgi:hypothetical protein
VSARKKPGVMTSLSWMQRAKWLALCVCMCDTVRHTTLPTNPPSTGKNERFHIMKKSIFIIAALLFTSNVFAGQIQCTQIQNGYNDILTLKSFSLDYDSYSPSLINLESITIDALGKPEKFNFIGRTSIGDQWKLDLELNSNNSVKAVFLINKRKINRLNGNEKIAGTFIVTGANINSDFFSAKSLVYSVKCKY